MLKQKPDRWTRALLVAVLAAAPVACQTNLREAPPAEELEQTALEANEEYVIGARDRLQVTVWRQDDLSVATEVRLDGKISVPLLDDVVAAGLTPIELKQVITERLSEFITAPHVTVVVIEIRSKTVYMLGEVAREGALPLMPDMRIVDAIALAGGFNPFSGKNRVKVIRRNPDGSALEFRFNYKKYIDGTNLEQNILLLPGDRIIVPEEAPFLP